MTKNTPQAQNSLHIRQSVIETIAAEKVQEIDGVYELAALKEKGAGKVRTRFSAEAVQLDIGVTLYENAKLRETCDQIQQAIKDAVQTMANIAVSKVNVYVAGAVAKDE